VRFMPTDDSMKRRKDFHIPVLELTGDSVPILCVLPPLDLEMEINSRSVLRAEKTKTRGIVTDSF